MTRLTRIKSCIGGDHGLEAVFTVLFADGKHLQRELLAKQAAT
jgi:hypothetical protein